MPSAIIYQFVTNVPSSRFPAHISLAREEIVDDRFTRKELSEIFGGLALFEDKKTSEQWIGIWGARKSSKFRRLLRERGAALVLVKSVPNNLRLKVASYGRPLDLKKRS